MKITKAQLNNIVLEETQAYFQEQENMNEDTSTHAWGIYETLLETLGPETLLQELVRAMTSQEAMDNFRHIAQMNDIAVGDDDLDEQQESGLNLSQQEQIIVSKIAAGQAEIDDFPELFEKLYEHYAFETGEMPYGTAKGRDGDPYEWITQKLQQGV